MVLRVLPRPRLLDVLEPEAALSARTMSTGDLKLDSVLCAVFGISDNAGDRWHRFERGDRVNLLRPRSDARDALPEVELLAPAADRGGEAALQPRAASWKDLRLRRR